MTITAQLIQACRRGERRAQFDLYERCYPSLVATCRRYETDEQEAAELFNRAFLKVLTKLDQYREQVPFLAWAKRIVINTAIDEFRKNRRVREMIDYQDFSEYRTDNLQFDWNQADEQFDAAELRFFINKLPPMSQKVFNLYAVDGYKHEEIAELLEISAGTSKWHLSSARKKLVIMLQQHTKTTKTIKR